MGWHTNWEVDLLDREDRISGEWDDDALAREVEHSDAYDSRFVVCRELDPCHSAFGPRRAVRLVV